MTDIIKITSEQEDRLCKLFRDAIRTMGFLKNEAQDLIRNGGLLQSTLKHCLRNFKTVNHYEFILETNGEEKMTLGQENRICDLFRDAIRTMNFSNDELNDFVFNSELLQSALKECIRKFESVDKLFELFIDLGIIIVADNYDDKNQLGFFYKKYHNEFKIFNNAITDANFNNPSYVLKPGDKLHVKIFKQTDSRATTSLERLAFLSLQKSVVYPGTQGSSLVWEQKRKLLKNDYYYCSLDYKENLWQEKLEGDSWFSRFDVYEDAYEFHLNYFEVESYEDYLLMCFSLVS